MDQANLKFIAEEAVTERRRAQLRDTGTNLENQILQFGAQVEDLQQGIANLEKRRDDVWEQLQALGEPAPAEAPPE